MSQLLHPVSAGPNDRLAFSTQLDAGALSARAIERAQNSLPWLREMPARRVAVLDRVTQAGIRSFQAYFRDPDSADPMEMFAVAPRELVRSVTLQQTLQLMRVTSSVVEETVATAREREASVVFSRQLAFAAAELYATVGDGSGLWERRLEQYVVDAASRGPLSDSLHQRIRAVGWRGYGSVVAAIGALPEDGDTDRLRRLAWDAGADVLVGTWEDRLVAIASVVEGHEADDIRGVVAAIADGFGAGPVLAGPAVADMTEAWRSLAAASVAADVVAASDATTRVIEADDLLPERALAGDDLARAALVERAYTPLRKARQPLLETARRFVEAGGAVEVAARRLDVHPNTVRYRLKRIAEVTGLDPTAARDSFVLQCALRLGLMQEARG
ncbi:helix-turn-helix domain-containing protein [Salinibacterium sp. SYSU T00001]|uniref:PucR family transcriptional regulator n=1 Tax=Homoserinimonas sedimenticola TaxID=2986805 RepID=UPI002236A6EA|nr:helix-turn-helix domain-containing protein [Salinibacterium sedimenticola]MCW4386074.1 helix-turn-helix domain-containing protein [Salinibacterium sedimenticola]